MYFVRRRGRVAGPFDASRLKQFAQLGGLHPSDEVSRDREQWTPVATVKGLVLQDQSAPSPSDELEGPPIESPVIPPKPWAAADDSYITSRVEYSDDLVVYCGQRICDLCSVTGRAIRLVGLSVSRTAVVSTRECIRLLKSVAVRPDEPVRDGMPGEVRLQNEHNPPGPTESIPSIASLALAVLALLLCWIPVVGLLAIPISIVALVMAAIGVAFSIAKPEHGTITSLGSGVLALLAIAGCLFSTGSRIAGMPVSEFTVRTAGAISANRGESQDSISSLEQAEDRERHFAEIGQRADGTTSNVDQAASHFEPPIAETTGESNVTETPTGTASHPRSRTTIPSTDAEIKPSPSRASNGWPRKTFTLRQFGQIKMGMSYLRAREAFGRPGIETSRIETEGVPGFAKATKIVTYKWENENGSMAFLTFENDKLTNKIQVGLK